MNCKNCENQLQEGVAICDKCGKNVGEVTQAVTSVTVASSVAAFAPAGIWKRLANYLLDSVFSVFFFLIIGIGLSYLELSKTLINLIDSDIVVSYLISFSLTSAYYLLSELAWQKTPAKFITKTKVVMRDGSKPPFINILGRSFARMIPFEQFSFLFSSYPVGWHDRFSKTMVVPNEYTPEDVQKINLEQIKKEHGSNVAVIIITIGICALVGIAILGILSAVVLSSLNTAREKARDAFVKSNVKTLQYNLEAYYEKNQTYSQSLDCNSGVFTESNTKPVVSILSKKGASCFAREDSYAISAKLEAGEKSYCVDSKGFDGDGFATDIDGAVSCRPYVNKNLVGASSWETFNSVQDNFSVLLPAYPEFSSERVTDGPVPLVVDSYISSTDTADYFVVKYKYDSAINADSKAVLEAILNSMANADADSKLISSSFSFLGSKTSLDFIIDNKGETLRGKIIFIDKTNIIILMIDSFDLNVADYDKFIGSFELK